MPPDSNRLPGARAALVIGHPGHELRVYRWLELAKPVVFVLTDGSGHGSTGRLESTRRVLRKAGATAGPIFGRLTDREVYDTLVRGDVRPWFTLVTELAEAFRRLEIDYVVADAAEAFNPTHDLCRYLTDAAAARASYDLGRRIDRFEFDLDAAPDARRDDIALRIGLDDEALDRKIQAGLGYEEMRGEVDAMLARFGGRAFAEEAFGPADSGSRDWSAEAIPGYERHGRNRVDAGIYQTLITFEDHLAPVQRALAASTCHNVL